jgi:hypothetical protein
VPPKITNLPQVQRAGCRGSMIFAEMMPDFYVSLVNIPGNAAV